MERFNSRESGRGGQGTRGGRGNIQPKTPQIKKTIEDYYSYVGSSKQASDFKTTYDFLFNHIKETCTRGNDISETLRALKDPDTDKWKPTLVTGIETDTNIAKRENCQF